MASIWYWQALKIATELGIKKAQAPMFHALNGCDTVSSFVGHTKKTAWTIWNVLPQLTHAMLALSHAPREVREDALQMVERFVILMYTTGPVNALTLTRPTQKFFADVKRIPPTKAALEQHVMRAVYQGGHKWGQALLAFPVLPLPTSWGWKKTEGGLYEPNWTTLPEVA